jgi:C-terminal processing protease CtpA/Prc
MRHTDRTRVARDATLLVVVLSLALGAARPSLAQQADVRRIERIEVLADVWHKLELHHPMLQTRADLDWDRAFIRALPRVEAARTSADVVRVLNEELFGPIGDPLSFARTQEEADRRDSLDVAGEGLVRRLGSGVAYLDAHDPAAFDTMFVRRLRTALVHDSVQHGTPTLLVVDLRWQQKEDYGYTPLLGLWTGRRLQMASRVSRLHRGHLTPTRWLVRPGTDLEPIGFESALAQANSPAAIRTPTVFLVNLGSFAALDRPLDALQRQPGIAVALETSGPIPEEWSMLTYPESIRVQIHSPMILSLDGGLGARADTVITGHLPAASIETVARVALRAASVRPARPAFAFPYRPIPRYPTDSGPLTREQRVLGLVRIWKEIGTFSAYLPYASEDWKDPLPRWIPRVEATASTRDYYRVLARLVAGLNDSHANVLHPLLELPRTSIPALLRREGNKVLVVRIDSAMAAGRISVGDEVVAVDGVSVRSVEDSVNVFRAASHRGVLARDTWIRGLGIRGPKDTEVRLTIAGASGRREVTLSRTTVQGYLVGRMGDSLARRAGLVRRLPENIGYIDLYRIATSATLDSALTALASTDGLILDARSGAPRWTGPDIRATLVSRFMDRTVAQPGGGIADVFMDGGPPVRALEEQEWTWIPFTSERRVRYTKPVAVLINSMDQSYSESAVWPFRLANRAFFVGDRTAGTNGGAPDFTVPGGAVIVFTHERVTQAGGGRYAGVGLAPDLPVVATPEGLRDGRDEVLDAAVAALRTKGRRR